MTEKYLKIKNWDEFQHYKDRDPKWIKVYRDITDNYEFSQLPDASKGHLLGLWLLAAKLDNKIPADAKWIATRINATAKIDLGLLERSGFIAPYSSVQNDTDNEEYSSVVACLETEKRREETEQKDAIDVKERWNDIASTHGLKKMVKFSSERRKKYISRCTAFGEDKFWEIIDEEIPKLGKFARDSGWFDFAWLINSDENFLKFSERKYRESISNINKEQNSPSGGVVF